MDFKSWKKQNPGSVNKNKKIKEDFEKFSDNLNDDDKAKIEQDFSNYANKSEDELMQDALQTAGRLKMEGKLTQQEVDNFYNSAKSFMNPQQLAKLEKILKMLGV